MLFPSQTSASASVVSPLPVRRLCKTTVLSSTISSSGSPSLSSSALSAIIFSASLALWDSASSSWAVENLVAVLWHCSTSKGSFALRFPEVKYNIKLKVKWCSFALRFPEVKYNIKLKVKWNVNPSYLPLMKIFFPSTLRSFFSLTFWWVASFFFSKTPTSSAPNTLILEIGKYQELCVYVSKHLICLNIKNK